jgi:SagB-type dehydrogenase family enzyme
VAYWENDEFVLENYLTGKQTRTSPFVGHILQQLDEYVPMTEVVRRFSSIPHAADIVERLIEQDVLVRKDTATDKKDKDLESSWAWGHDARFFHYSSRRVLYEEDLRIQQVNLAKYAVHFPSPSPFKLYKGPQERLPKKGRIMRGEFWQTLESRRTRRSFTGAPITLLELSIILFWTWGCTNAVENSELGPHILKTSPSGGSRHPIEVYPVVLRTNGMEPGVYHYSVRDHALTLIRGGYFQTEVLELCSNQPWIRDAAVVFFMTAVLERTMWKYKQSLAYRVLCLDAGHLGQTFHLVCTCLGLAPFTTAATRDNEIERFVSIDGISEIALYTAAVGRTEGSRNA